MAQAKLVSIANRVPNTAANTKASTVPIYGIVRAAYAEFLAKLAGHPPCPIPVDADSIDLEDRADHVKSVISGLAAYLTVVLDETVHNTPATLDLCNAEAVLADLASDLAVTIERAANELAWRLA
jgi:hypothetical protein